MNFFSNAIAAFHDLNADIDEIASKPDLSEHEVDTLHFHCQLLINDYYGDNKWKNDFTGRINDLVANKGGYHYSTRLRKLKKLNDNIQKDLRHQEDLNREKQKRIDERLADIATLKHLAATHKENLRRLHSSLETCKNKIEITHKKYQEAIDVIKGRLSKRNQWKH
jgi:hypothetical protein